MTIKVDTKNAKGLPSGADVDTEYTLSSTEGCQEEEMIPATDTETPQAGDDYPLLEGVSIDRLPERFKRMITWRPASAENQRVDNIDDSVMTDAPVDFDFQFYPRDIPIHPCFPLLFFGVVGVSLFLWLSVVSLTFVDAEEKIIDNIMYISCFAGLCILLLAFLSAGVYIANDLRHRRESLFVKDSDGALKFSKENWKSGTYLVGNEMLIDYDGKRVWCYPTDKISEVKVEEHNKWDGVVNSSTFLFLEDRLLLTHTLHVEHRSGICIRLWHIRNTQS